jgi:hypothetical protein
MKTFLFMMFFFCVSEIQIVNAQSSSIDRVQFFNDTSVINATIIANMGKLFRHNKKGVILPANFVTKLTDGTNVNDEIQLEVRGNMRHDYCYVPPLKLIFKYKKSSILASLKSLKLVNECKLSGEFDQYIFKEFIAYKIYNLITDMSFRVRLLNVTFEDSAGKKKPITEHAFLLEDIKELAKRNNCKESEISRLTTESTDRRQMTIVAIFQYMIGNTDWAVSADHNIKLIAPLTVSEPVKKSYPVPYVVPYDFDYSGLVNTEYAVPSEDLQMENVRERLYRGYPRTMDELNDVLAIFKNKKDEIYSLINNFNLLTGRSKEYMISYLEDFYKIISKPADVKSYFIDNARTQ